MDGGCRIEIIGVFDRTITMLEDEIDTLGFHDLSYMISFQFGVMSMTSLPSFGARDMDSQEVTVRYSQVFIGDVARFKEALHRYCGLVKHCHTREFKTDVGRSFNRKDEARCNRAELTTMEIIKHPKFEGAWPIEDEERQSPWRSLKVWYESLSPTAWNRLRASISMKLQDGGSLNCSYTRGEITFNWAGMYGAIILSGNDFSSHT